MNAYRRRAGRAAARPRPFAHAESASKPLAIGRLPIWS
jgi:hypothetical protein